MVYKIGDNITSPLGSSTEQNYKAVIDGCSALALHQGRWDIPEDFCASLFNDEQVEELAQDGLSRLESLAVSSIRKAIQGLSIDLSSNRVVLILSSAKGNVEDLTLDVSTAEGSLPSTAAKHIAESLGMTTMPIAVCNACISGVSAITLGKRLLEVGTYDYAIVCGADCQSKFVVSGFQSLKSMSDEPCRPFDEERLGLNLGEAAATLVLSNKATEASCWSIESAAVANDANHLTNPSKTGEGCYQAIRKTLDGRDIDDIAFINAHGTATMYNDQMESVAIERAELNSVPVNALKGYFGHTMGAAGVLETVLCMYALDHNIIIGTRGYNEIGVSGEIDVCKETTPTQKQSFLKLISGFGGCNGVLLASRCDDALANVATSHSSSKTLKQLHRVHVTPQCIEVDGKKLDLDCSEKDILTVAYKTLINDYAKFYKMDKLCRLGFVATELLLQAEGKDRYVECQDRAVVLFNRHSSVVADIEYLKSISDKENYFPSPSAFIYTLPNIVTGEIAIRNKYHGETVFYVLPEKNTEMMNAITHTAFADKTIRSVISGWLDYDEKGNFEADLAIVCEEDMNNIG
ncbi:MAG: 3-oxoacyl-ACP synthase [Bacteroidales bacterium]|nr:3-oxoacyl-ACP synthase [Bacteroidales bacterium]